MFQHTAARRRLVSFYRRFIFRRVFQHTAARRRLGSNKLKYPLFYLVSTHSRPKAAGYCKNRQQNHNNVSTHSRPKAAGLRFWQVCAAVCCFNTQPPEGGWSTTPESAVVHAVFQHTAARRRLADELHPRPAGVQVSTHSRPKAAGGLPKA